MDFPAGIGRICKGTESIRHDRHGRLSAGRRDSSAVTLVTGDHCNARNRQIHRVGTANMTVKRDSKRCRSRFQNCRRHRRSRIASVDRFDIRRKGKQNAVGFLLVRRVNAAHFRRNFLIDALCRMRHAFAAKFCSAVKPKLDLVRSDRHTGCAHGSAHRAVFGCNDCFDSHVSAVGIYLMCFD